MQFGFEADNIPLMIEAIPVKCREHCPDHHQSGGSGGAGYTFFQVLHPYKGSRPSGYR